MSPTAPFAPATEAPRDALRDEMAPRNVPHYPTPSPDPAGREHPQLPASDPAHTPGCAAPPLDEAGRHSANREPVSAVLWIAGLAVALGAAVATAHGLYEVAVASRVPAGIAWLYPLITDGLALVAYAATARLSGSARRYAWAVVILAAGLSGLAQAAYLAGDGAAALPVADPSAAAPVVGFVAPAALRFGVGAWPAIAAAIVAHLLYLLAADDGQEAETRTREAGASRPATVGEAVALTARVSPPAVSAPAPPLASGALSPRAPEATPAPVAEAAPRPRPSAAAAASTRAGVSRTQPPQPVPAIDAAAHVKVAHLQRWTNQLGRKPSRDIVKKTYRVGSAGADALLAQVAVPEPGALRRVQ